MFLLPLATGKLALAFFRSVSVLFALLSNHFQRMICSSIAFFCVVHVLCVYNGQWRSDSIICTVLYYYHDVMGTPSSSNARQSPSREIILKVPTMPPIRSPRSVLREEAFEWQDDSQLLKLDDCDDDNHQHEHDEKLERIHHCLMQTPIPLWQLRELALSRGGLVNGTLGLLIV